MINKKEPIEARLHLCESCTKEYPECEATINDIEFGCGVGNDNVIGCTAYVNRWKAQEPTEQERKDLDVLRRVKSGKVLKHVCYDYAIYNGDWYRKHS